MSSRIEIMREVPGMADAAPDAVVALAGLFDARRYEDEVLCEEGDRADSIFLLVEGAVEVYKRSKGGREIVSAVLGPGTLFGHVGMFAGARRTAGVRALGKAEVLVMSTARVQKVMREWDFSVASPLRRALIIALARQLAEADRTVGRLAAESGAAAVPSDAEERLIKVSGPI